MGRTERRLPNPRRPRRRPACRRVPSQVPPPRPPSRVSEDPTLWVVVAHRDRRATGACSALSHGRGGRRGARRARGRRRVRTRLPTLRRPRREAPRLKGRAAGLLVTCDRVGPSGGGRVDSCARRLRSCPPEPIRGGQHPDEGQHLASNRFSSLAQVRSPGLARTPHWARPPPFLVHRGTPCHAVVQRSKAGAPAMAAWPTPAGSFFLRFVGRAGHTVSANANQAAYPGFLEQLTPTFRGVVSMSTQPSRRTGDACSSRDPGL